MDLCRLFIDESGNGDLKAAQTDPNNRYLSLTGIITKSDLYIQSFEPELQRLKEELFGESCGKPIILHRREIVRREGAFSVLRDKDLDGLFRLRFLGAVNCMPYLAMTVAIDKKEHQNRYKTWQFDPYHYCLQCLTERYVSWLERHDCVGDVVIESRTQEVDKKLKASFQRTYAHGTPYVDADLFQRRLTSREIKLVRKKANVAGLQFCDMIAHPCLRAMRRERNGEPRLADFGYEIVSILEEKRYARNPKTKQIDGWGRKWLP